MKAHKSHKKTKKKKKKYNYIKIQLKIERTLYRNSELVHACYIYKLQLNIFRASEHTYTNDLLYIFVLKLLFIILCHLSGGCHCKHSIT